MHRVSQDRIVPLVAAFRKHVAQFGESETFPPLPQIAMHEISHNEGLKI
jgi:hypothetical protein